MVFAENINHYNGCKLSLAFNILKKPAPSTIDDYSWRYIYQVALEHKKQLITGHLIAVLATIASVPVPLLMPLLVDEVLLDHPGMVLNHVNPLLPIEWQNPVCYIAGVLIVSLLLRLFALVLNIIQTR